MLRGFLEPYARSFTPDFVSCGLGRNFEWLSLSSTVTSAPVSGLKRISPSLEWTVTRWAGADSAFTCLISPKNESIWSLSSGVCSRTTLRAFLPPRHWEAKWLSLEHLLQVLPLAGQGLLGVWPNSPKRNSPSTEFSYYEILLVRNSPSTEFTQYEFLLIFEILIFSVFLSWKTKYILS